MVSDMLSALLIFSCLPNLVLCGKISKELIDFNLGDEPCPLSDTVRDQITITNNTGKKLKYQLDPIPNKSCKITFEPAQGTLPKAVRAIPFHLPLLSLISYNV